MLVNYVEDRDLWRFRFEETKGISAYLYATEYDFENWDFLRKLLEDPHEAEELFGYGNIILKKQTKDINELLQNKFRFKIGGHEVWTANLPYTLCSDAGHILAQGEPFASTFYLDGKSAIFSLRSDEDGLDVSEVARLYGGGGHKHAAGFKVPHEIVKI
jgi:oligoribonuclease NrnB/cAMP/cGMP phosphodiesterase (DHH superfamily)